MAARTLTTRGQRSHAFTAPSPSEPTACQCLPLARSLGVSGDDPAQGGQLTEHRGTALVSDPILLRHGWEQTISLRAQFPYGIPLASEFVDPALHGLAVPAIGGIRIHRVQSHALSVNADKLADEYLARPAFAVAATEFRDHLQRSEA